MFKVLVGDSPIFINDKNGSVFDPPIQRLKRLLANLQARGMAYLVFEENHRPHYQRNGKTLPLGERWILSKQFN